MSNCTDVKIEQSDWPNMEIPSSDSNIEQNMLKNKSSPPKIEIINSPDEVSSEHDVESHSMADNLKNMQLNTSDSSWETTTDTSVNSSPTQSLLENCDGLDSASLSPKSPLIQRRARDHRNGSSESSCSSSSNTGCSEDSSYSSTYCSCSSCSSCGGCKCPCSSESSTSLESTDELTKKPRGKKGSPLNNKEAKQIKERCSQS